MLNLQQLAQIQEDYYFSPERIEDTFFSIFCGDDEAGLAIALDICERRGIDPIPPMKAVGKRQDAIMKMLKSKKPVNVSVKAYRVPVS